MESDRTIETLKTHIENCWKLHREYKETKDKIFFFIGTLFTTLLVGSGILIYLSNTFNPEMLSIWHYLSIQAFFFLLFILYNYNRLISEMYLFEAEKCSVYYEGKFGKVHPKFIPHTSIKNEYIYHKAFWLSGSKLKYFSNWWLGILYIVFASLPLAYRDKLFEASDGVFKISIGLFVTVTIFVGLSLGINYMYQRNIKHIKATITECWK